MKILYKIIPVLFFLVMVQPAHTESEDSYFTPFEEPETVHPKVSVPDPLPSPPKSNFPVIKEQPALPPPFPENQLPDSGKTALLAAHPAWNALLHYNEAGESDARGKGFFIAEDGYKDPVSELFATIKAMQLPPGEHTEDHAVCRFPARLRFLKQNGFYFTNEHLISCESRDRLLNRIAKNKVSLVFASHNPGSAASMFGHTLIKLEGDTHSDAVNFAAGTGNTGPVSYVIKGLTGGFQGYFSFVPYNDKLFDYTLKEDREVWEFELDLTPDDAMYLTEHVWELKEAWFPYYYTTENCSYRLLELIRVLRPGLNLKKNFRLWVLPGETVRVVQETSGLVKNIKYIPSVKERNLTPEERKEYSGFAEQVSEPGKLPLMPSEGADPGELRSPPAWSHLPWRTGIGASVHSVRGNAAEFYIRPVLHDLLDRPHGYPEFTALSYGNTVLQLSAKDGKARISEFIFADVLSLKPLPEPEIPGESFFSRLAPWSWGAAFSWTDIPYGDSLHGTVSGFKLRLSAGKSFYIYNKNGIILTSSVLAAGRAWWMPENRRTHASPGISGLITGGSSRIRFLAEISGYHVTEKNVQTTEFLTGISFFPSRDTQIRLTVKGSEKEREMRISFYLNH